MKVEQLHSSLLVRNFKIFEEFENAGSEISYKCNKAWDCKIDKEHEQTEIMSIKEEDEQDVYQEVNNNSCSSLDV